MRYIRRGSIISCDSYGRWVCRKCSGIDTDKEVDKVGKETKKIWGLWWTCDILVNRMKEIVLNIKGEKNEAKMGKKLKK